MKGDMWFKQHAFKRISKGAIKELRDMYKTKY